MTQISNKNKLVALTLFISTLLINTINGYLNNQAIYDIIIFALIDFLLLEAYIKLPEKPIQTVLIIIVRQLIITIQDMWLGMTPNESISSNIGVLFISTVILFMQYKLSKINQNKAVNFKEKLKLAYNYERKPIKLNIPICIILYSIILTVIFQLMNSETLELLSNKTPVKLYGAVAVALPVFEILAIISTTTWAYQIIVIYEIIKIITLISTYKLGGLNIQTLLYAILQLIVILYSIRKYNCIKQTIKSD